MLRLPRFDYSAPGNLAEAIALLGRGEAEAKVIAGGTDLLVKMKRGEVKVQRLIGLKNIPGLDLITENGDLIKVGSMVTHSMAGVSPLLEKHMDFLSATCRDLGSYQVQCMGTIAGNICNASPSADSIPPLLVLEAELKMDALDGERRVPIDQFFVGPFETVLKKDEIVTAIEIQKPPPFSRGIYLKVPKVTEKDETLAGLAMLLTRDPAGGHVREIRIALSSVAPTPMRARRTESYLKGKDFRDKGIISDAEQLLMIEISPRSRAESRRKLAKYLFHKALDFLLDKVGSS